MLSTHLTLLICTFWNQKEIEWNTNFCSASLVNACTASPTSEPFFLYMMKRKTQNLEDCWESLGLPGDQTSQSERRSTLNIHWKDWCWSGSSNTLVTWCKEWSHWKRPWCWGRLRAGEGDDRGWDGCMTQYHWLNRRWVWANSRRWRRTGKPGVLQSMGSQRVGHNWAMEQQQQNGFTA